jgi:endogenous inhibitor of DNA gyrase (YacG/DUF329 family)
MPECPECKKQTVRYEKYIEKGDNKIFVGFCIACNKSVSWAVKNV